MHASPEIDYLFIGMGASGVLMLLALERHGLLRGSRIMVVDPETKVQNDKTFCFWAAEHEPIVHDCSTLISHSWPRLKIDAQPVVSMGPMHYHHIRSVDLYAAGHHLLNEYGGVWLQDRVRDVVAYDGKVAVRTDNGTQLAQTVFDSRPPKWKSREHDYTLAQSFVGYRVKLLLNSFEHDVYEMMDFRVDQAAYTQFCYTLPFSSSEALVELTRFGSDQIEEAYARHVLDRFILEKYGPYELIDVEAGIIPMTSAPVEETKQKGVIALGTRAGQVKPSTGYAFKNMHAHALVIAQSIAGRNELPSAAMNVNRFVWYDRLLLRILRDKPHLGAGIFKTLFRRCGPDHVFRFLDESTKPFEEVVMFSRLPIGTFLEAAVGDTLQRMRPSAHFWLTLMVGCLLLIMSQWSADAAHLAGNLLAVVGLALVGIPHGALDEVIELKKQPSMSRWWFYARYLTIIAVVMALWHVLPAAGLLIFLIYSAYHFGQTDFVEMGVGSSVGAFAWGSWVLMFLLYSHPDASTEVLRHMGVSWCIERSNVSYGFIALGGMMWLALAVRYRKASWLVTLVILAIGSQLSLFQAFSLYFIGLHSTTGWKHLRNELGVTNIAMQRMALPYTAGALLLFGALVVLGMEGGERAMRESSFYIFLACVSLPHILVMRRAYRAQRTPTNRGA